MMTDEPGRIHKLTGPNSAHTALTQRDTERRALGDVLAGGQRLPVAAAGSLYVLWNRAATFNVYEVDDAGLLVEVDMFTNYVEAAIAGGGLGSMTGWASGDRARLDTTTTAPLRR